MGFFIAISYLLNIIAVWVILTDTKFALSIGIRTRGNLLGYVIWSLIPFLNWVVAMGFLLEYIPYAYPKILEAITESFDLDKEL
jgi:hypothetical protein